VTISQDKQREKPRRRQIRSDAASIQPILTLHHAGRSHRHILSTAMPKAAQSRAVLISEHHRVTDPDPPRRLDIRVCADQRLVLLCDGAQEAEVARQVFLTMRGHHASHHRNRHRDFGFAADLKRVVKPLILNEAAGFGTGVDQDVRTEAAGVEARSAGQTR
jgi:hypothetical protein